MKEIVAIVVVVPWDEELLLLLLLLLEWEAGSPPDLEVPSGCDADVEFELPADLPCPGSPWTPLLHCYIREKRKKKSELAKWANRWRAPSHLLSFPTETTHLTGNHHHNKIYLKKKRTLLARHWEREREHLISQNNQKCCLTATTPRNNNNSHQQSHPPHFFFLYFFLCLTRCVCASFHGALRPDDRERSILHDRWHRKPCCFFFIYFIYFVFFFGGLFTCDSGLRWVHRWKRGRVPVSPLRFHWHPVHPPRCDPIRQLRVRQPLPPRDPDSSASDVLPDDEVPDEAASSEKTWIFKLHIVSSLIDIKFSVDFLSFSWHSNYTKKSKGEE